MTRTLLITIFSCFLFSTSLIAQDLILCSYLTSKGDYYAINNYREEYGLMDGNGKVVLEVKYHKLLHVEEGLFIFQDKTEKKYGLVEVGKGEIVPPKYDEIKSFSNGYARVFTKLGFNYDWGLIDKSGKEIIPLGEESMLDYAEGLVPVKKDNKWGFMDLESNWMIDPIFSFVSPFKNGFAPAKFNDLWGYIDKNGEWTIKPQFADAQSFNNGLAVVKKKHSKAEYLIDRKGKLLLEQGYSAIYAWGKQGLWKVQNFDEKYAIVNNTGKPISKWYKNLYFPVNGFIEVSNEGYKDGLIDLSGKEIIPLKYEDVGFEKFGLIAVNNDWKWGYFDTKGNKVIDFQYDKAFAFISEDRGVVLHNNETLLIDRSGRVIDKYPVIAYGANLKGTTLRLHTRSGFFIFDDQLKLIKQLDYDEIGDMKNGYSTVKSQKNYGIIDLEGELVVPTQYSQIMDFSEGRTAAVIEGAQTAILIGEGGKKIGDIATYKYYGPFKEGLAKVVTNVGPGYINKDGEIAFTVDNCSNISDFAEGLAFYQDHSTQLYGFINQKGKKVIEAEYQELTVFKDGIAIVKKDGKFGAINTKNKAVVPLEYDDYSLFFNDHAFFKKNDKWGLLDKTGKVLLDFQFEDVSTVSKGSVEFPVAMKKGSNWGFVDQKGDWVTEAIYTEVGNFHEGYTWVKSTNGKVGVINAKGESVVPNIYSGGQMLNEKYSIVAYQHNNSEIRAVIDHTNHILGLPWVLHAAGSYENRILVKGDALHFLYELK
ncbi:MAG: WG repeat-containing protein [Bacteroidota bacterium]